MAEDSSKPPTTEPLREYDNNRDMALFWATVKPRREPMQQLWFLPVVLVLVAISIPWYRSEGEIGRIVFGLPAWIWVAVVCSACISILTAIMATLFWDDDEEADDKENPNNHGGDS